MTKVSGCIVTYQCYDKCREAIRSLFEHTRGVDFTLYIVDNASGDDTLARLKAEFPAIVPVQLPAQDAVAGHPACCRYAMQNRQHQEASAPIRSQSSSPARISVTAPGAAAAENVPSSAPFRSTPAAASTSNALRPTIAH